MQRGTTLLGAVRVAASRFRAGTTAWSAVLQVDDEPLAAYRAYLSAMGFEGDASTNPDCHREDDSGRTGCSTIFTGTLPSGALSTVTLRLASIEGDIVSRYLLLLDVHPAFGEPFARPDTPRKGADLVAEPPHPAAGTPSVGDELPGNGLPRRLFGGGSYRLLEGTELVAKYGSGSITGGFNVLLRLTGAVPSATVLQAYSAQASQSDGAAATADIIEGDTRYTTVDPPGEAGGFQATLTLVDQPGNADDYLFYDLVND